MKTQTQTQTKNSPSPSQPQSSPQPPAAAKRYKELWLVEDMANPTASKKAWWTRVGVAFENKDGSWNLHLSAVPVGGNRLQMRDPRPDDAAHEAPSAAA